MSKLTFLNRRFVFTLLAVMMVVTLAAPALVTRAADPTDAAGLIQSISSVTTAFPILTIIVTAVAIAGVAMYLVRRAKSVAR